MSLADQLLLGMSQGPVRDKRTQEPMVILAGIAAFESWLPNIFLPERGSLAILHTLWVLVLRGPKLAQNKKQKKNQPPQNPVLLGLVFRVKSV